MEFLLHANDYVWFYSKGKVVKQLKIDDIDSVGIVSKKLIRMYNPNKEVVYSSSISNFDSICITDGPNDSLLSIIDFSISKFLTKEVGSKQQGMDICNNQIFALVDGGSCHVYSYTTKQFLGFFDLGSKRSGNHCNSANFGTETAPGASFPLLYVSIGKPGDKDEFALYVESITQSNGTYSSKLVQTIRMDQSRFADVGLQPIWGCPNWMVDKERGYLWAFSAIKRTLVETTGDMSTNKYVATKYRIPTLSEGKEVVFTEKDVLDQAVMTFDTYITQGGTMHDGLLYYCYGYGGSSTITPARIRIYDTDTRKIVGRLELEQFVTQEPEDLSIYNGKLYLNTNSDYIYELTSKFWGK